MICLDENYSTTRLLAKEKPLIKNATDDKFATVLFLPENSERKGEGGLRTKGYFKRSYDGKPLVTIITVVYNGKTHLEETIQSVLKQTYDNIEYIVIDGGSTDGTLEIIRKYDDLIDYWVSELDNGIYDAMNKAIVLAAGDYIGIIGADDFYFLEAVDKSVNALIKNDADYSMASIKKVPSGKVFKPTYPLKKDKIYQGMMYPHNASFIKKDVYKKVGLFNTKYTIAADFEMALRIHFSGYEPVCVDDVILAFREGGASDSYVTKLQNRDIAISFGKSSAKANFDFIIYALKHFIAEFWPKKATYILRKKR